MRSIIVAYDSQRGIGEGGRPLWRSGQLPADTRHFRALTADSSVIMGRSSFETFHGRLPGRQNIIITRRERLVQGVSIVHSIDEAYEIAEHQDVNVIGGASIFRLAINSVDRVYATEIDMMFPDADAFFPKLDSSVWDEIKREFHQADGANLFDFSFVTYERRRPRQVKQF